MTQAKQIICNSVISLITFDDTSKTNYRKLPGECYYVVHMLQRTELLSTANTYER